MLLIALRLVHDVWLLVVQVSSRGRGSDLVCVCRLLRQGKGGQLVSLLAVDVVQLRKLVLLISSRLLLLLLHLLLHKGLQLLLLVSKVVLLTRWLLSTCIVGLVTILSSSWLLTLCHLPWHHESTRV